MYADMQAKQAAEGATAEAGATAGAAEAQGASAQAADDNIVDAEVKEVKKG
jgi:molecular chaperone DnaK